MHTDFENALLREPVQAILTCIMSYTTEEQRKVIYEKLGRRVEPVPASLEQEAERLYPDVDESTDYASDDYRINEVKKFQRSAHITAARQYMGEIEKLRAENEKMRKGLKAILKRCGESGNDYGQAVYEISEMSYEAIKIDFNF